MTANGGQGPGRPTDPGDGAAQTTRLVIARTKPAPQGGLPCPSGNSPSPLAAVGSHLPQRSSLPSGGILLLLVRVGTKPSRCALLAARQVPAQPFRSLDSATGGAPSWPKRSMQENDPKGEAFRHCSRNDMHPPPLIPLPRYSLFLQRGVALPAHAPFGRGNGRGAPCPTVRPDRLPILGGGGFSRGRAAL